jgi:excisionase family DNA binding protein
MSSSSKISASDNEHRDRDRLLTPDEVAVFLGVPLRTIYRWRSRGDGPRGYRVGRHVRYRVDDIEDWLEDHRDAS